MTKLLNVAKRCEDLAKSQIPHGLDSDLNTAAIASCINGYLYDVLKVLQNIRDTSLNNIDRQERIQSLINDFGITIPNYLISDLAKK